MFKLNFLWMFSQWWTSTEKSGYAYMYSTCYSYQIWLKGLGYTSLGNFSTGSGYKSSGGGVPEWFRALDLKSRGPRFKSSTLSLNKICFSVVLSSTPPLQLVNGQLAHHRPVIWSFGRRSGLHVVVSTLDSGLRGLGSNPGRVIVLCSWARHFNTLTVPLSTQEYKWVPVNCQGNLTKCWEVTCNGLASHPGGVVIINLLMGH